MSTLADVMRSKSRLTLFSAALLVILSFACYGMSESQVELQASQDSIFSYATENDSEGKTLTVTVDGTNLRFSPDVITLVEGDTVRFFWENQLLAHNAVEENGLFDSGDPERNVEYNYTFQVGENGTYQYVCEPHASLGMVGTIIVEPMPVLEPEPLEPAEDEDDSIALSVGSDEISAFFFCVQHLHTIYVANEYLEKCQRFVQIDTLQQIAIFYYDDILLLS